MGMGTVSLLGSSGTERTRHAGWMPLNKAGRGLNSESAVRKTLASVR